ncbi:TetR/AcrR family transcriptional regulator [Rhodococcus sp. NPDC049939]|uniref:TetR/AcrR family transcriptional regulator n=1 Tax=Rhodococcus sp. NPDC049939 TaxID=3155511 RepID=UPI0033F2F018
MTPDWMREERPRHASERILDVAAALFVEKGITAVGMADVARSAGCSRATLYRYFDSRQALQLAFVHREARRIGALIAAEVSRSGDAGDVIVNAMLAAIRLVREDPTLAAWFQLGDSGLAGQIANSSDVIESLGAAFLGHAGVKDEQTSRKARWLVRIIVSLLTVPGTDADDERTILEQFVAPVLVAPARD